MVDGLALSALHWWEAAGIDMLVDESPRDWLARSPAVATPVAATPAPPPAPEPVADLASLRRLLLTDPALPGRGPARLDASGDPASGTMILLDMPEAADRTSGTLLSGDAGAQFDRMLGAMDLARTAIYLAAFSPARPPSGRLSAAECAALAPLARAHVALAGAKRLLLMGEAPVRALLGLSLPQARGQVHSLDLDGGAVPCVASHHPRFVMTDPELRRPAWADLQLFMGL